MIDFVPVEPHCDLSSHLWILFSQAPIRMRGYHEHFFAASDALCASLLDCICLRELQRMFALATEVCLLNYQHFGHISGVEDCTSGYTAPLQCDSMMDSMSFSALKHSHRLCCHCALHISLSAANVVHKL